MLNAQNGWNNYNSLMADFNHALLKKKKKGKMR